MASDEYGMASFGADFDRKDGNKVAGIGFDPEKRHFKGCS
jgi:hypothetical protein